jgi:hypothetical protein
MLYKKMTVFDRLEKIDGVHNQDFKIMALSCDFKKGYAPENSNTISFLEDNKTYVIIEAKSNYHHSFVSLIIPCLEVLETLDNKNLHFIICDLNLRDGKENFDNLLIELLQERKISYTEINGLNFEYMNVKNFIPINGSNLETGVPMLYNYLVKKYNVDTKTPNKKIYISRKNYFGNDIRIDNEAALEDYFIKKGFQVVYPEEITTFKEQFELLNSCSTLAALSGSGLTGLIFMQKNQKVIEIVSELMVGYNISEDGIQTARYEIHDHYMKMSLLKNHEYFSVQNLEKQAELVKTRLDDTFSSLDKNV